MGTVPPVREVRSVEFDLAGYLAALRAAAGGIVIKTESDLTPRRSGRRIARLVGVGGKQIIWYLGRRRYRSLLNSPENRKLTQDWISAGPDIQKDCFVN